MSIFKSFFRISKSTTVVASPLRLVSQKKGLISCRLTSSPPTSSFSFVGKFRLTQNRSKSYLSAMAETKPNVVFVLGAPGAGKGTQCQLIVDQFGFEHLSAGDLLRAERKRPNSEYGELIENHIKEGSIVPVQITCSLLERAMNESPKNDFLIDGFPRNEDNLTGWQKQVGDKVNIKFVLYFTCKEETCVQRCLDRGAAGSGRSDDNLESLKKRFRTYVDSTMPIIEHFRKLNLVVEIDGDRSKDEVFAEVQKHFQK